VFEGGLGAQAVALAKSVPRGLVRWSRAHTSSMRVGGTQCKSAPDASGGVPVR
jgi:hypothetical protein